ncbi:MAG: SRPBCC family protein [Myxococcota bacterium]|nr:SRPBCC family protein [Myxococcota bacterium]
MQEGLREVVEAFDPHTPIAEAATPPSSWYTTPEMLALERRSVFRTRWVAVGRAADVATPGQYVSGSLLGEPYVIVRDQEGVLHAFDNVCRHHATTLVRGRGCVERFQCPYHGWTYDLDGRLTSAPRMAGVAAFNRDAMGLLTRHAATWGPILFLFLGEDPPDLAAQMAPLTQRLEVDTWAELTWSGEEQHPVESNWKVYVDNYLDGGYHVPTLHQGLTADIEMSTYTLELFDAASIQRVQASDPNPRIGEGADYVWVYPNLMVNRYGPVLDVNIVLPESVDKTTVRFDYWFEETEGAAAQRFMADSRAKTRQVQNEDAMICASVQRGLASSGYETGRYAPRVEQGEHHFHRLLAEDYHAALDEESGV